MTEFEIQFIDASQSDVSRVLDDYRKRLSPQGTVVSEAGRQKTIEVFGEPLSAVAGRDANL